MKNYTNTNSIDRLFEMLQPMGALKDEPMKNHTSFKIGGNADIFFTPENEDNLVFALNLADELNVPVFIMGNGTNLLVSDNGIRGLVIALRSSCSNPTFTGNTMTVSASELFSTAVKKSVANNFMGLEWGAGIPGTVGGAVSMNAGAYGGEIKDRLVSVRVLIKESGKYEIKNIMVNDGDLGYRFSRFSYPDMIVLNATFSLLPTDGKAKERMDTYTKYRTAKQPLSQPSAGSVFKRPEGYFAGTLIEEAKLKGICMGGAQVSTLHAGFIVNTGNATAQDVLSLIDLIKKRVYEQSGVMLCEELKLIGG